MGTLRELEVIINDNQELAELFAIHKVCHYPLWGLLLDYYEDENVYDDSSSDACVSWVHSSFMTDTAEMDIRYQEI